MAAHSYDAYGETCDLYNATGNTIAVPWRFQGRILESATGATDLYDFGARSYDPSLGTFIGFDSVSGSAQNPLTLNRYLYALANPASFIDPSGHCAWNANTHQLEGDNCLANYTDQNANAVNGVMAKIRTKNAMAKGQLGSWIAQNGKRSGNVCSDPGCFVGGLAEDVGAGIDRAMPGTLWTLAAVTCALAWETGIGCLPLAAIAGYTAANAVNNLAQPGSGFDWETFTAGWNWKDAATTMVFATAAGALSPAGALYAPVVIGGAAGFASDIVQQQVDHPFTVPNVRHATCSAIGGAASASVYFGGSPVAKAVQGFAWSVFSEASTAIGSQVYSGFCGA